VSEHEETRDAVRGQIAQAFGPDVMAWVEADADGYGHARAEADAEMAAYAAWVTRKMREFADGLNDGSIPLPDGVKLPEGMRFEWW
jgi:hypothetical protein